MGFFLNFKNKQKKIYDEKNHHRLNIYPLNVRTGVTN